MCAISRTISVHSTIFEYRQETSPNHPCPYQIAYGMERGEEMDVVRDGVGRTCPSPGGSLALVTFKRYLIIDDC